MEDQDRKMEMKSWQDNGSSNFLQVHPKAASRSRSCSPRSPVEDCNNPNMDVGSSHKDQDHLKPDYRRSSPGGSSRGKHSRHSRSRSKDRGSRYLRRSRSRDKGSRPSSDRRGRSKDRTLTYKSKHRDRSRSRSYERRHRSKERRRNSPPGGRNHYRDHRRGDRRSRSRSRSPYRPKQTPQAAIKAAAMQSVATKFAEPAKDFNVGDMEKPSNLPLNILPTGIKSGPMTPQLVLQQTMAAMSVQAQTLTGVALPKYYNPAAVNPLKYAEQMQKRKLLWQANKEKPQVKQVEAAKPAAANHWAQTHFTHDDDGKVSAKFRKLMGLKGGETSEATAGPSSETPVADVNQKQEALFRDLDQQYEMARMTTHTHRGVGLGYSNVGYSTQPLIFPK